MTGGARAIAKTLRSVQRSWGRILLSKVNMWTPVSKGLFAEMTWQAQGLTKQLRCRRLLALEIVVSHSQKGNFAPETSKQWEESVARFRMKWLDKGFQKANKLHRLQP